MTLNQSHIYLQIFFLLLAICMASGNKLEWELTLVEAQTNPKTPQMAPNGNPHSLELECLAHTADNDLFTQKNTDTPIQVKPIVVSRSRSPQQLVVLWDQSEPLFMLKDNWAWHRLVPWQSWQPYFHMTGTMLHQALDYNTFQVASTVMAVWASCPTHQLGTHPPHPDPSIFLLVQESHDVLKQYNVNKQLVCHMGCT